MIYDSDDKSDKSAWSRRSEEQSLLCIWVFRCIVLVVGKLELKTILFINLIKSYVCHDLKIMYDIQLHLPLCVLLHCRCCWSMYFRKEYLISTKQFFFIVNIFCSEEVVCSTTLSMVLVNVFSKNIKVSRYTFVIIVRYILLHVPLHCPCCGYNQLELELLLFHYLGDLAKTNLSKCWSLITMKIANLIIRELRKERTRIGITPVVWMFRMFQFCNKSWSRLLASGPFGQLWHWALCLWRVC